MSLEQKLQEDMKDALRAGRKFELATLRTTLSQIKDERIRLRPQREINDEDVIRVIASAVKKRRDSIELFQKGNRPDLAEKEQKEIDVISVYLPKQLSHQEIEKVVDKVISEIGAASLKDLGKVMGPVMGQLKGRADGKVVQNLVKDRLSQTIP